MGICLGECVRDIKRCLGWDTWYRDAVFLIRLPTLPSTFNQVTVWKPGKTIFKWDHRNHRDYNKYLLLIAKMMVEFYFDNVSFLCYKFYKF